MAASPLWSGRPITMFAPPPPGVGFGPGGVVDAVRQRPTVRVATALRYHAGQHSCIVLVIDDCALYAIDDHRRVCLTTVNVGCAFVSRRVLSPASITTSGELLGGLVVPP